MGLSFADAFEKTIGKETKPTPTPSPASGVTSDDMKAYVDAKFSEIENTITTKMEQFFKENNVETVPESKVETPKETPQADNNIEKEGE